MTKRNALKAPPRHSRSSVSRGLSASQEGATARIDPTGGDYGAGLIRGLSVITRGEALGHGMWVDLDFLSAVADKINAKPAGIKGRFTHPGLSSDGLGKFLGRVKNAVLDGDRVRGDLHIAKTARKTPDGDLGEYVMGLAAEDPEAFGTSIVFDHDYGEEDRFVAEYEDEDGNFKSPDADNSNNFYHARLAEIYADDVVDDPAANPDGLFHRGDEIASEADAALCFALGLTEEAPQLTQLTIDPERGRGFVTRFLAQHGLQVVQTTHKEDSDMELTKLTLEELRAGRPDLVESLAAEHLAAQKKAEADALADAQQVERKRCSAILAEAEKFGLAELGAKLIADGLSVDAALGALKDAKIEELTKSAPTSPGPNNPPAAQANESAGDSAWQKAFEKDAALQREFGDVATYLAFKRAETGGYARIMSK